LPLEGGGCGDEPEAGQVGVGGLDLVEADGVQDVQVVIDVI
jgi:hypothetical protein